MAAMNPVIAVSGTAANANYDVIQQSREDGGVYVIYAAATAWASASVLPQYSRDGTNYLTMFAPGGTTAVSPLTADGYLRVSLPVGCQMRVNITSATGSTDTLNVHVGRLAE